MKIRNKSNLRLGDTIKVITGNHKGFVGKIKNILSKKSIIFVENILPRTKYLKASNSAESKKVELEIPIHISNVMLWEEKTNQSSRIGYKFVEGKKYRYFKKSGNLV